MTLKATSRARIRVLLIVAAASVVLATAFWFGTRNSGYQGSLVSFRESGRPTASGLDSPSPVAQIPAASPIPTTTATPGVDQMPDGSGAVFPTPADTGANNASVLGGSFIGTLKLVIPVAGIGPDRLTDTFTDARSEGRAHDAIDIMAPAGTPVLAATDGEIVRLFQSDRGGITIYQLSSDKKLVFYYAHLQRYADGLVVGKFARQGEVIAYVGDTGNAGAGNYHLHFSIAVLVDPKRYFGGTNINPYPLLRK